MFQSSSILVDEVLTCCPPAPPDRTPNRELVPRIDDILVHLERIARELQVGDLATDESVVISRKPSSRAIGSRIRFAFAELDLGDREAQVRRPAVADVLDDHVDVDAGVGERAEDARRDAGPVGDLDERDLRDVPIVGQATDLVPLLHERVLLDERSGGVLERAEDLDDDVVDPAQLDGPGLHDLGALVGELEHLLVADDR